MTTDSPFITHRSKVLGRYSTALWLRQVVLSLHYGASKPVGLSGINGADAAHFAAYTEMINHYRIHGEFDPTFQALVTEVEELQAKEKAVEERTKRLEEWNTEARSQLRSLGHPDHDVDGNRWFESRFDGGDSAAMAAAEFALLDK